MIHDLERLRCSTCGEIFCAKLPESAGKNRFDPSSIALVSILKYRAGMPFYRLSGMQKILGCPLSDSTQWDMAEKMANFVSPVFDELLDQAAEGELFHADDTSVRILSNPVKIKDEKVRKGTFTTGILSKGAHEIAFFMSGNDYAAENLKKILEKRKNWLSPPIVMWDAINRNNLKHLESEDKKVIESNCTTHARRGFVDVVQSFPRQVRVILFLISKIYANEKECRERNLCKFERLKYHVLHSKPVMDRLYRWLQKALEKKLIEENSTLGKSCLYMIRHREKLTEFLRTPGCPIDNNPCERLLKIAVLNRKNAYFYKNEIGALVGDMLMSVIQTAAMNGVNVFEYFVELQKNHEAVRQNPKEWLPWNYLETLKKVTKKEEEKKIQNNQSANSKAA